MIRIMKTILLYGMILLMPVAPASVLAAEPLFAPLEELLIKDGLDETFVRTLYQDKNVKLEPRILARNLTRSEKKLDYSQFLSEAVVTQGRQYSEDYRQALERAHEHFGVPSSVVVAILSIETRLGGYTGNSSTVNILSTMAVGEQPEVQEQIFSSFQEPLSKEEFQEKILPCLHRRARRGYQDLKALLEYASKNGLDPLSVKGSLEGAIGIPQFLPSNITAYGRDGDGDGIIDLFNHEDAIASVASFLYANHWNLKEDREVILRYNRSTYYADTVLALAKKLQ